jgi:hypothetical protein
MLSLSEPFRNFAELGFGASAWIPASAGMTLIKLTLKVTK